MTFESCTGWRLTLLRAAVQPAALVLMLGFVTASSSRRALDAATGPVMSVRGLVCGVLLLAAAVNGVRAAWDWRCRTRELYAGETDPTHLHWSVPGGGIPMFLKPRMESARRTRADVRITQVWLLAVVPVWLLSGEFGVVVGVMLGGFIAVGVGVVGMTQLLAEAMSDAVVNLEACNAAAKIPLTCIPAGVVTCAEPVAVTLLERLDVAAGSMTYDVLLRLAAEAPRRSLVEVVDLAKAVSVPARRG